MRLKGKVAIITGGSQGIGEALSRRFAREGATVAIVNRTPATAEAVVGAIRAQGGTAHAFCVDIAQTSQIRRVIDEIAEQLGGIDILINNAGLYVHGPAETMREADYDAMAAVNLKGPYFLIQSVIPHFRRNGGGKIVNIGSIFGNDGFPGASVYGATKAALAMLTKVLCLELRELNINVNCIVPGWVATALNESMRKDPNGEFSRRARERFGADGVWLPPEEVTGVAVFLASDDAAAVNGAAFHIDRGWSAY